jgi:hypothetical protein
MSGLTVGALIEELLQLPMDTEILIPSRDDRCGDYLEASVREELVFFEKMSSFWYKGRWTRDKHKNATQVKAVVIS